MIINYNERQQVRRTKAFRWTNDVWNDFNFNAGWSIGLTTKIAYQKEFDTLQEWESYYFQTGSARIDKLRKAVPKARMKLLDLRGVYTNPKGFKQGLTKYETDINEGHGRTSAELKDLAKLMHREIVGLGNPYELTVEDVYTHIYIRVIDESFIGIQREANTLKTLVEQYPNLTFAHTHPDDDRYYAIDVEAFDSSGQLLCGFQIKSQYFNLGKTKAMKSAQSVNLKKHKNYTKQFSVPAYFIKATVDGEILNKETFSILNKFSHTKSLQTV